MYKDDVPEILEKMIKADIIVLASPIYFYSITGQMKTLIDRSYAKFNLLSNKEFYFILSCAAPYEDPYKDDLDIAINSFRGFIKCLPNAIEKNIIIGDNMTSMEIEKTNYISSGSMIVCGTIAGIWSFTANRFNLHEIVLIIIGGIAIGYGINLVINGVLKKLECKNTIIEEDNTKTKKNK